MDPTEEALLLDQFSKMLTTGEEQQALIFHESELENVDWNACVLVKVISGRVWGKQAITEALKGSWRDHVPIDIQQFHNGSFIVKFSDAQARDDIYLRSPWHLKNDLLAVMQLHKQPTMEMAEDPRVLMWVQFHNLPSGMMNYQCVWRIAQKVGSPLPTHPEVASTWGMFARMKVEVKAIVPLMSTVQVQIGNVKHNVWIHYEKLHKACTYCGKMGHEIHQCQDRNKLLQIVYSYPQHLHQKLLEKIEPKLQKWMYQDQYLPSRNRVTGKKPEHGANTDYLFRHTESCQVQTQTNNPLMFFQMLQTPVNDGQATNQHTQPNSPPTLYAPTNLNITVETSGERKQHKHHIYPLQNSVSVTSKGVMKKTARRKPDFTSIIPPDQTMLLLGGGQEEPSMHHEEEEATISLSRTHKKAKAARHIAPPQPI